MGRWGSGVGSGLQLVSGDDTINFAMLREVDLFWGDKLVINDSVISSYVTRTAKPSALCRPPLA